MEPLYWHRIYHKVNNWSKDPRKSHGPETSPRNQRLSKHITERFYNNQHHYIKTDHYIKSDVRWSTRNSHSLSSITTLVFVVSSFFSWEGVPYKRTSVPSRRFLRVLCQRKLGVKDPGHPSRWRLRRRQITPPHTPLSPLGERYR